MDEGDNISSVVPVLDGYIAVGTNEGNSNALFIKYNKDGSIKWKNNFGGNGDDYFNSVIEVEDGYVVIGGSSSTNIDGITNKGEQDAIIVKYNKNGEIVWKNNFGGADIDEFKSVIEVEDGYIVVGDSYSTSFEGINSNGEEDAIIIKYDKNGNVVWKNNFGGTDLDAFNSVIEVEDGYIVAGFSFSTNIDGINSNGEKDAIIVKYNKDGSIKSKNNFGGNSNDEFRTIVKVEDGFIVAGYDSSTDIDGITNQGGIDGIIVRYNQDGNVVWKNNFGGNDLDAFNSIIEVEDGYIVVGGSKSSNIEGITQHGQGDAVIVKYNKNGNIVWKNNFGGTDYDIFKSITKVEDGLIIYGNVGNVELDSDTSVSGPILLKYKYINKVDASNEIPNNDSNETKTDSNTNNDAKSVVDVPSTLSLVSKIMFIISGLLILVGIGIFSYNYYKVKKNNK